MKQERREASRTQYACPVIVGAGAPVDAWGEDDLWAARPADELVVELQMLLTVV